MPDTRKAPHASPDHVTKRLLAFLAMLLLLSGCNTIGKFYTNRIRPASYYVNQYCFELPKEQIIPAIAWLLKKYHFPVTKADTTKGRFQTKPVYLSRYSRNPNWGYVIGLDIRVREYKGKLKLDHLPEWALRGKQPKLPPYPQRSQFPNPEAYYAAQEKYTKLQMSSVELSAKGFALMNRWAGCRIRRSTLRTMIEVKASIKAHPIGGMGTLDRSKGCQVPSTNSLEHAIIRVIAWRLKRLKYVPVMQYDRAPRYSRGDVCAPPKPKKNFTPSR